MQKQNKNTSKKPISAKHEPGLALMCLLMAVFLVASFLYQYLLPFSHRDVLPALADGDSASVVISEVMSANSSAHPDDAGKYSDWIELHNTGDKPVSLSGWTLTKPGDSIHPLSLPDIILSADEYLLIYADGNAQTNAAYALHAPYKLTAAGDALALQTSGGQVVDAVEIPSLEKNESYARNSAGEWEITRQYTPGLPNTPESFALVMEQRTTVEDPIEISEVMIKNRTYAPDEDGDCSDYIELHNTSSRSVNLAGYALSDSDSSLTKWLLPSVTLEADGYLLIYASGKTAFPAHCIPGLS